MKNNYLIISHPRSGSNYLFDCLTRIAPGANFCEPFPTTEDFKIVNKGKVIKTHLYDFLNLDKKLQKKLLSTRYTVLLLRKNIFESAISDIIAAHFQQWNSYTYTTDNAFSIDKKEMIQYVDGYVEYWKKFINFKNSHNLDKIIYYEDLTFNSKKDLKNFFNIDKTYLLKISEETKAPNKNIIVKNYNELESKYLKYIKDIKIEGAINKNGKFIIER